MIFLRCELFWFCLVQVSTIQFDVSHLFSWRVLTMEKTCRVLLTIHFFEFWDGSRPDVDGMGHRACDAQFKEIRDMLLPLVRGFVDFFANHVKTISDAVVLVTSRMTMSNRSSITSLPRWSHLQRWNRMSAPSRHACAIAKQI